MIIKGTDLNYSIICNNAMNRKINSKFNSLEDFGIRKYDVLDLSSVYKKKAESNDINMIGIQKMLSDIESDPAAKKLFNSICNYVQMDVSLCVENMKTQTDIYLFESYSAEKNYYTGLLNGTEDGISTVASKMYDYEYVADDVTTVDRVRAEKALANVQERIDKLLEKLNAEEPRINRENFNNCTDMLEDVSDASDVYDKLFGKTAYTEENAADKLSEKLESLKKYQSILSDKMDAYLETAEKRLGSDGRRVISEMFKLAYKMMFNKFEKSESEQ